jgi:hypothetical protein
VPNLAAGDLRTLRDAILLLAFAAFCLFAPIVIALSPRDGAPVAVIAPPWSGADAAAILAAAEGRLLEAAANRLVAIGIDETPGFAWRLYGAGALLVLDARAMTLCRPPDAAAPRMKTIVEVG